MLPKIVIGIVILAAVVLLIQYNKTSSPISVSQDQKQIEDSTRSKLVQSANWKKSANWKTYTSDDFSFQYPEEWIIETDRKDNKAEGYSEMYSVITTTKVPVDATYMSIYSLSISTRIYADKQTLEQIVKKLSGMPLGGFGIKDSVSTTLGGKEAHKLHQGVDSGEQWIQTISIKKDIVYILKLSTASSQRWIDSNAPREEWEKFDNGFIDLNNKIVSSFKFTE